MTPGPDIVIACPHCRRLMRLQTLMTGNTIGTVVWSDGYVNRPMLPPPITATCCRHCRRFFWVDTAQEVGTQWPEEEDPTQPGANAPYVDPLTIEQLAEVVRQKLWRDEDEELETRFQWRWRINDPCRESGQEVELSPEMEANLRRIAEIYQTRKAALNAHLAELAWHLNQPDQALELLEQASEAITPNQKAILKEAIKTGKRKVIKIHPPP